MSKFKVGDKVIVGKILNCSCAYCKQLEGEILKIDEINYVGPFSEHNLFGSILSNSIKSYNVEVLDTYCKLFIDDIGLVCKKLSK